MNDRRILIIDGHPDPEPMHFCHALADAYAAGAEDSSIPTTRIKVAALDFSFLCSESEWRQAAPPVIAAAQEQLRAANHLVLVYPLWLGDLPARLKAFLEHLLRPGFAFDETARDGHGERLLHGKSAHVLVTMGMPAPVYRWVFGAHTLKSLERNILGFCGIAPIEHTLIGGIGTMTEAERSAWLERAHRLGACAG